jgi:hypothetical protein
MVRKGPLGGEVKTPYISINGQINSHYGPNSPLFHTVALVFDLDARLAAHSGQNAHRSAIEGFLNNILGGFMPIEEDRRTLAAALNRSIRHLLTWRRLKGRWTRLSRTAGAEIPTVATSWRRAWIHVIPFFAFPLRISHVIYTTNAIESVHARLRKIIKTRSISQVMRQLRN